MNIRGKVALDAALKDVEAAIKEAAKAGKTGIVGYCWGGFISWMSAAKVAGLACAVPY
jgi:carboxymethylenebutenolidase